jgi:hypothetical protein
VTTDDVRTALKTTRFVSGASKQLSVPTVRFFDEALVTAPAYVPLNP